MHRDTRPPRYRPLPGDPCEPGALPLAGGRVHFARVEEIAPAGCRVLPADALPDDIRARLTAPRPALGGVALDRPQVMAVLNLTPDSFSDGGVHTSLAAARLAAHRMAEEGAALLDVGGESTRPGAVPVPLGEELARVLPLIHALSATDFPLPISIDTRKAAVMAAAVGAGAAWVNDVSALAFDPASLATVAALGVPVCLMHARGLPGTMQDDPRYDDPLLEIYGWLEARVATCEAAGIARARILVDPGIGFGKTVAHNLALLRGLSLFHGLGCAVMVGVSRKGFLGRITGQDDPAARVTASVAAGLDALAQGVQILRVHDVAATVQAIRVWTALREKG